MLANLLVALAINALQIGTLLAAAVARRIHFHPHGAGALWFVGAAMLLTGAMYGVAEILASRIPRQVEYLARVPAVAIAPGSSQARCSRSRRCPRAWHGSRASCR